MGSKGGGRTGKTAVTGSRTKGGQPQSYPPARIWMRHFTEQIAAKFPIIFAPNYQVKLSQIAKCKNAKRQSKITPNDKVIRKNLGG
ncbi:hypothetical protein [Bacteroides heparinolyticus]|uniref:hypothetical protein n=1 Tax=Prevotella heparinolytica TaxID=28113 RepID=UPI003AEF8206